MILAAQLLQLIEIDCAPKSSTNLLRRVAFGNRDTRWPYGRAAGCRLRKSGTRSRCIMVMLAEFFFGSLSKYRRMPAQRQFEVCCSPYLSTGCQAPNGGTV